MSCASAAPRSTRRVRVGGELSDRKGLNRKGGGISAPAISERDREDIRFAAAEDIDYVAVSFVRTPPTCWSARSLLRAAGGEARLVSKIERHEAIDNLSGVIEASDVVMVARGDLGRGDGLRRAHRTAEDHHSSVPHPQQVVITATQMMESMI